MNDIMIETTPLSPFVRFSVWLPFAALVVSMLAFALGLPARIARSVHRSSSNRAYFQGDSDIHDDPALFLARAGN